MLPGLQLLDAWATPARISRSGRYLADGADNLILAINREGTAFVESARQTTIFLMLIVAGLPVDWLLALLEMSMREFQAFALFIIFGSLLLIHAIATSDSAP
jgi:putative Ca2+/H+ antiporter (TMEM165/GDT1 family)